METSELLKRLETTSVMRHLLDRWQLVEWEPLQLLDILARCEAEKARGRGSIMEDQMPCPMPFEGFDVAEAGGRHRNTGLVLQDSLGGIFRMLRMAKKVIGQEPAFFAIIGGRVLVSRQQHVAVGNQADICNELVDLARALFHLGTPLALGLGRAAWRRCGRTAARVRTSVFT